MRNEFVRVLARNTQYFTKYYIRTNDFDKISSDVFTKIYAPQSISSSNTIFKYYIVIQDCMVCVYNIIIISPHIVLQQQQQRVIEFHNGFDNVVHIAKYGVPVRI